MTSPAAGSHLRFRAVLALALGTALLGGARGADAQPAAPDRSAPDAGSRLGAIRRAIGASEGPTRVAALREALASWDEVDPVQLEEILLAAAGDPKLDPPTRVYAELLRSDARRKRGDLAGAEAIRTGLGFVERWMVVGPFDHAGGAGLDAAYQPEQEATQPIVPGRAFDGKTRTVRWRPVAPGLGATLELGDLLRPKESICAYAVAFVEAAPGTRTPRPVSVWVGATGAFKVFWDGAEILRDAAERTVDEGRLAATVRLAPGPHRLMVKVCGAEAPALAVRLGDAAGAPERGLVVRADFGVDGASMERSPAAPRDVLEGTQARGFLQRLDASVARNDPAALEAFARYLRATGGEGRGEHRARDMARRAAEAKPTVDRLLLAGDLAEDPNQLRSWVDRAAALAGDGDARVLRARIRLARGSADPRTARPHLERLAAVAPDDPLAPLGLAEIHVRAGLPRTAIAILERALETSPRTPALLRALAAQLRAVGRDVEADEVDARHAAYRFDDSSWLQARIERAVSRRDVKAADRWVDRLLAVERDRHFALGLAARVQRATGRPDRARASLERALGLAPEDEGAMRALAELHGVEGRRDDQLRTLRRLLALHPQAKDVRLYVESLEPTRPRPDEALAWDDEKFLPLRDQPRGSWPRRTLRDLSVATVYDNGLASRFRQVVFQPLTDEAAATARQFVFAYHADRQEVQIRAARVYRRDGRVDEAIESGEGAANDPSIAMYTSMRTFFVQFPKLEPGDVVELRYRIDDVGERDALNGIFDEVELLQSDEPVQNREWVLLAPRSLPLRVETIQAPYAKLEETVEGGRVTRRIRVDAVPPAFPEPGMPPWSEVLGQVRVSTFPTWDALGKFYWHLARPQLDVDDEVRAKIKEIAADARDDAAKAKAVYRYAKSLRYVALEFGIEGIRPRRCALTLARGWGDCKDKAAVIVTMLRELGVDARMVLVRTMQRGLTVTEPPSLATFDHAIAYVPSLDLYLDGTAEGHGTEELPAMDRGAIALVVSPEGGKLVRLPDPPPQASPTTRHLEVTLAADGSAAFQGDVSIRGAHAPELRARYAADGSRRDRVAQDLAPALGPVELAPGPRGASTTNLGDVEAALRVGYAGRARSFGRRDGDTLTVPVATVSNLVASLASPATRRHDLLLGPQALVREERTIRLPAGARATGLPRPALVDTPFGKLVLTVEPRGDAVVAVSELTLARSRITPAEYAAFRAFCAQVDAALAQRMVITLAP